jgi:hypothetical protein
MKYIFSFAALWIIGFFNEANAQVGQEFWFAAPEVTSVHTDRPIYLRISAQEIGCVVTIDQPANPSFIQLTYTFNANETQTIDLTTYIADIETATPDTVLQTGLYISSTENITAYYEVRSSGNNPDIFSLKSDNALGLEFFLPAQSFWENASNYTQAYAGFLIVASEDNTLVTITTAGDIVGHNAGVAFSIVLNEGETYYARAISRSTTGHLGGSTVVSSKPIAITISDDSITNSSYGGCKDLIGDQTIPVSNTGTEYIVIRGFLESGSADLDDKVYVLATEDNTSIYIEGSATAAYVLAEGQQQEISLSDDCLYITSDKNIYVMHVTGFGCEVGMAVLPNMYCTGSMRVNVTRSTSEDFYLLLLVPNGSEADFKTDGNSSIIKTNDFSVVNGTNGQWQKARIKIGTNKLDSGVNTEVTNLTSRFHLGVINGGASTGCMYGYFSDYASVHTDPIYHY